MNLKNYYQTMKTEDKMLWGIAITMLIITATYKAGIEVGKLMYYVLN